MNDGKTRKLLKILADSYYEKRWISMEDIVAYTLMSSFNQRIQTMREHDIDVQNKMEGDKSFYRMFTDPMTFNWSDYTARQSKERIRRTGRKQPKVEAQGRMAL